MANIIDAIINLIKNPVIELNDEYINKKNRANSMGEALEEYVKDLFANSMGVTDENKRLDLINENFSYLGNQNNPPDAILKYGDAIEVKKIESPNSSLALNSSYPKAKLFSNSKMINNACRICEPQEIYDASESSAENQQYWIEKDIIYVVGVVKKSKLSSLVMVYGCDYAAESEVYESIRYTIKNGVEQITDVEFQETNELGRVNRVDPLGITYLRIRGMWGIDNPFKVFEYVFQRDLTKRFNFMAIINLDKWETFNNKKNLIDLIRGTDGAELKDIKIKDPNNPAILKSAKLISFQIKEN